jgi:glycosyltransferase involved in cell wall biosynthesis
MDVVEVPDWFAEGLIFALERTRPLVAHLHTPLLVVGRNNPESFRWTNDGRLAARIERLAVRRADLVTSPSHLVADELVNEGWTDRAPWIIRYPIDVAPWAAVESAERAPPRVLAVGRLEGRKAPEVLVRAAALLKRDVADFEAVFLGRPSLRGDGSYRDWLVDLAQQLDAPCTFVDQVDRTALASWYGSSRVVALPSRYDNFPYVGLEAMAAARPVVCTARTGTAEIVAGTEAGEIVGVDDVTGLAQALRRFLIDPAAAGRAGREARAVVERECSVDRIVEQREACYLEAIQRWEDAGFRRFKPGRSQPEARSDRA